jgi:hypothetical protein
MKTGTTPLLLLRVQAPKMAVPAMSPLQSHDAAGSPAVEQASGTFYLRDMTLLDTIFHANALALSDQEKLSRRLQAT